MENNVPSSAWLAQIRAKYISVCVRLGQSSADAERQCYSQWRYPLDIDGNSMIFHDSLTYWAFNDVFPKSSSNQVKWQLLEMEDDPWGTNTR